MHFQPDDEVAKAGRSVYQIYSRAVKEYLPCMKSQVWLYVNRYSENRRAGIVQKEQVDICMFGVCSYVIRNIRMCLVVKSCNVSEYLLIIRNNLNPKIFVN